MSETPGANYSSLDRFLHRMAFSGLEVQKSLADIEDRTHAARLGPIKVEKPVFITGLPRAGTTLLLDVLARSSSFVTHTYRCMPFVLCPIMWDSISRGFHRPSENKERAHGDGMSVGYDSAEAFDEVLWKAFWPKKYHANRIDLWAESDRDAEFEQFFRNHIRKLIVLNIPEGAAAARYLSKNNANIARILLLRKIFPDAAFITPFREPVNQAASLLRQHARFVKIHAEDAFARRYMDDIGHYEFGAGLRLIDFPDDAGMKRPTDPMTGDFWLSYWIRCYGFLAALKSSGLRFIDFDRLCDDPLRSLAALGDQLECRGTMGRLEDAASEFHPAVRYDPAEIGYDPLLLSRARALHEDLSSRAL